MQKTVVVALAVFLISILSALSAAADSKLDIYTVSVSVDNDKIFGTSSSTGKFHVEPGDDLLIKVVLRNEYDDDTHNDIKARMTADFEGLSDSDSTDSMSVRAGGERTVTLKLSIPEDASSYESYYLTINAYGTDENGTSHSDEASYDIFVDREEHELVFNTLRINDIECGEYGILKIELENKGEETEEDIRLEAWTSGTGILFSDKFDLTAAGDDEDNTYSKEKRIDLSDIDAGHQSVTVRATYDDRDKTVSKTIDFTAEGCGYTKRDGSYQEFYDAENRNKRVDVTTEPYYNPNRDLSFLYRGGERKVVLELPEAQMKVIPKFESGYTDTLSIVALALANIAIIIFIILLGMTIFQQ